jgi:ketosteroid isomerase-like protein
MTVDLARAYAEAMEAKDLAAFDSLLADDVCVVTPKGVLLEGVDAVKHYYSGPGFDHLLVSTESQDFREEATGVRHLARQVYRWKESGEEAYARPLETIFEFADGKIVRIEMRILKREAVT